MASKPSPEAQRLSLQAKVYQLAADFQRQADRLEQRLRVITPPPRPAPPAPREHRTPHALDVQAALERRRSAKE